MCEEEKIGKHYVNCKVPKESAAEKRLYGGHSFCDCSYRRWNPLEYQEKIINIIGHDQISDNISKYTLCVKTF